MFTVYRLFRIATGESYIGCTGKYRHRLRQHKHNAKHDDKRPLYKAIREHGWNYFASQILGEFKTKEMALNKESDMVVLFDSYRKGYNLTENGKGGVKGRTGKATWNYGLPTEQQPGYMSKALVGRKASIETRRKMSEATKGEKHHFYGKSLTDKHKKNLSESLKGRVLTKEHRKKLQTAMTKREHTWGNKISESTKGKAKLSARKLTEKQVREIYKLKEEGMPQRKIGTLYNIGKTSVAKILSGRSYNDIYKAYK